MSGFVYKWCLSEEDYRVVCQMMTDWGMAQIHRRMLSEYGAIVYKEEFPVCSGWLYQSDSKMAWIEWVIMNKKATKKQREGALTFLFDVLFNQAKALGFEVVMCIANHPSYMEKLKNELGFIPDEKGMKQQLFFKNLWQQ